MIVASPTAGSAGIVPGLLLGLQEVYKLDDEQIIQALFNASAIGYLAMRNATVAGAVGGCQAEVGVASAMAASAIVELLGGDPEQCLGAASTVLMNMLGLVCDPVGGWWNIHARTVMPQVLQMRSSQLRFLYLESISSSRLTKC